MESRRAGDVDPPRPCPRRAEIRNRPRQGGRPSRPSSRSGPRPAGFSRGGPAGAASRATRRRRWWSPPASRRRPRRAAAVRASLTSSALAVAVEPGQGVQAVEEHPQPLGEERDAPPLRLDQEFSGPSASGSGCCSRCQARMTAPSGSHAKSSTRFLVQSCSRSIRAAPTGSAHRSPRRWVFKILTDEGLGQEDVADRPAWRSLPSRSNRAGLRLGGTRPHEHAHGSPPHPRPD